MNNICPICGGELLQMLSRKLKDNKYDYEEYGKHFGHWCDSCKKMFKQKWEFEVYE